MTGPYTKITSTKTVIIPIDNKEDYELLKTNGNVSVSLYNETTKESINITGFKYVFKEDVDEHQTPVYKVEINNINDKIKYNEDLNLNCLRFQVKIGGGGAVTSFPASVYSTTISSIPTVYNETYGICNYLDDSIPFIECLTKIDNVNVLKLKVVSADPTVSGNVVIKLSTENFESDRIIIPVTSKEIEHSIQLINSISGTLKITRLWDDADDTLNDASNGINAISMIITQIKVETLQ